MSKKVMSARSTCDLPLRTINLFVLNKLYLLGDSPSRSVIDIAERLVGLHAKRAQTPYLSIFARNPELAPSELDKALYEDRVLLRAHCMRGTVHILPVSQYRTVLSATEGQLDGMYRRAFDDVSNKEEVEEAVLARIRKEGPLSHAEIASGLKIEVGERELYLIINELCTRGILVKATVNGSWRSSIYNYELLDRWQPDIPEGETDAVGARSRLIEWYLSSYGPATTADIAWWAGMSQAQVNQAVEGIDRQLSLIHFQSIRADALIFDEDLEALGNWRPPDHPQVNLLPGFDPYVMAYADRGRYVSSDHYPKVFKRVSGIIESVITVDGWFVGTWKYSLSRGKLASEVFERLKDHRIEKEVEKASQRVADFLIRADAEGGPSDSADAE